MGVVYEAEQLGLSRRVAIKLLDMDDADPSWAKRFESEAQIVATLRHPNTLRVFDYGRTEDGLPYLVSELLEGEPVSELLRSGPVDPKTVLQLVRDVARALAEAHAQGIVHRDVKPQNLVLERVEDETLVKVLDFGLAKRIDRNTFDTLPEPGVQTLPGTLVGTPAYLSPEQANGRPVVAASDLYSLGATAFHLLTGRVVFDGEPLQQIFAHGTHAPPRFSEIKTAPEIDPEIEALVLDLLQKAPGDRPPSAAVVAERAEQLLAKGRGAPNRDGDRKRRTSGLLAVFVVAVLLGAAATAFQLRPSAVSVESPARAVEHSRDPLSRNTQGGPPEGAFFGRLVKIVESRGFETENAPYPTVAALFERIARCHADAGLSRTAEVRFEVARIGLSISVWGDEDGAIRDCLRARLDRTLAWPPHPSDPAIVVVKVMGPSEGLDP